MGKSRPTDGHKADNPTSADQRLIAQRLTEANLSTDRFIDVEEGRKQSYDHTKHGPDAAAGNYGVYCGDGLLGVDIDDHDAWKETPGTESLPKTFTASTPHDGKHLYYRVTNEVPWSIAAMADGSLNPSRQWGELYTSKYLVGPGSEIHDCDKLGCHRCEKDDHGKYEIEADLPIAGISSEEVAPLLQCGSKVPGKKQTSIVEYGESVPGYQNAESRTASSGASRGVFTYQLKLGEKRPEDPDKQVLWRIVKARAESSAKQGARFDGVLDQADENGIGCYRAAEIVRSWLRCGVLGRASDPNRIVPQHEEWEQ